MDTARLVDGFASAETSLSTRTSERQGGFLIPPWYRSEQPDANTNKLVCLIYGFTLALAGFSAAKASKQSWRSYQRNKFWNAYIIMIWAEWFSSVGISITSFLFLQGIVPPSFWTFFIILIFWLVQMHCILQIIANRLSVLILHPQESRRLKLAVFSIVTFITVTVSCTWMPARLQISESIIRVNNIWDRASKGIFVAVDAALNIAFLIIVYRSLIAAGLKQYWILFRFNSCMVLVSILLDITLIGAMSLPSSVVYFQFNPLVFLTKLYIELNLAELIARVVHSSNVMIGVPRATGPKRRRDIDNATMIYSNHHHRHHQIMSRCEEHEGETAAQMRGRKPFGQPDDGILRTVEFQVLIEDRTAAMIGETDDALRYAFDFDGEVARFR
ncbi:uncharacterized protein BCR38DRAFT_74566 [Pseudomassariella vexata]|uniref:Integral membrane protein n=1 Tax=Pseudomassariella vexata TaxID=1141098 RepID=A0A1Y2DH44_9PEZI|nr:uncharacterized protein BCR38DRAFT_74566 [Pseudomassariella vexata]ORY58557.1 hypothetical protein BCR38DRAFT_74566 [Pseudomassariella vexata]